MSTISSGRPPRPCFACGAGTFPAFSDSTSSSAAFRAGTPKGPAAAPERSVTTPTLNGAAWAAAGAAGGEGCGDGGGDWAAAGPKAQAASTDTIQRDDEGVMAHSA